MADMTEKASINAFASVGRTIYFTANGEVTGFNTNDIRKHSMNTVLGEIT